MTTDNTICSVERAEKVLNNLAATDVTFAELKGALKDAEGALERAEAYHILCNNDTDDKGKPLAMGLKRYAAINSDEYKAAHDVVTEALVRFQTMKNRRQHWDRVWNTWRTETSAKKQGMVI